MKEELRKCEDCGAEFTGLPNHIYCRDCGRKRIAMRMQSESLGCIYHMEVDINHPIKKTKDIIKNFERVVIKLKGTDKVIYDFEKVSKFRYKKDRELLTRRLAMQMKILEKEELIRLHRENLLKKPLLESEIKLLIKC